MFFRLDFAHPEHGLKLLNYLIETLERHQNLELPGQENELRSYRNLLNNGREEEAVSFFLFVFVNYDKVIFQHIFL